MNEVADQTELKRAFALAFLRTPNNAFQAALTVMPLNQAMVIQDEWPHDPEVKAFIAEIKDNVDESELLPSKSDTARAVYEKAESCGDPETAFKGFKLYSDIMGFINKPGDGVTVNNTLVDNRSVMVVKDHGSDEDWEKALRAQQEKLVHDAAEPIPVN